MTAILLTIGNALLIALKAIAHVIVWTVKATVKAIKIATPYIVKAIKVITPYVVKALKYTLKLTVKLIRFVIKGLAFAIPAIYKEIKNLIQDTKKRKQNNKQQSKSKNKTKTKSKEKTNFYAQGIKKMNDKMRALKEKMDTKAIKATATIGAVSGASIAAESLLNNGQFASAEFAIPAMTAAGLGTYAAHKIHQEKAHNSTEIKTQKEHSPRKQINKRAKKDTLVAATHKVKDKTNKKLAKKIALNQQSSRAA